MKQELPGHMNYDKLFKLIKAKGIKTGDLKYRTPSVSTNLFKRLREGHPCSTSTLIILCDLLECQPGDIMEYVSDKNKDS